MSYPDNYAHSLAFGSERKYVENFVGTRLSVGQLQLHVLQVSASEPNTHLLRPLHEGNLHLHCIEIFVLFRFLYSSEFHNPPPSEEIIVEPDFVVVYIFSYIFSSF
jgi:hypothetical protein